MPKEKINEHGYKEYVPDHSNLVHRQIAFKELWCKHPDKYPLPFSEYQVHHRDRNKLNNEVHNLDLLTAKEHEWVHKYPRTFIIPPDNDNPKHQDDWDPLKRPKTSKIAVEKKYLKGEARPCLDCLRPIKHEGRCYACNIKRKIASLKKGKIKG